MRRPLVPGDGLYLAINDRPWTVWREVGGSLRELTFPELCRFRFFEDYEDINGKKRPNPTFAEKLLRTVCAGNVRPDIFACTEY